MPGSHFRVLSPGYQRFCFQPKTLLMSLGSRRQWLRTLPSCHPCRSPGWSSQCPASGSCLTSKTMDATMISPSPQPPCHSVSQIKKWHFLRNWNPRIVEFFHPRYILSRNPLKHPSAFATFASFYKQKRALWEVCVPSQVCVIQDHNKTVGTD